MYEVDNLFAWIMQHSTQEVIGILVGAIAVAIPLACIVLAFIDTVIDYALRYVNEDKEQRRVIRSALSYEKQVDVGLSLERILKWHGSHRGWVMKSDPIIHRLVRNIVGSGYADCEGDYRVSSLRRIAKELKGQTKTVRRSVIEVMFCAKFFAVLAVTALTIFFLPLWLILSVGVCYAVLRTARFITRYSKKFNTHIEKEH
jgi:hypothetical protein